MWPILQKDRLFWLDSLRGLAALLVTIFHLWMFGRLSVKEMNVFDKTLEFINYGYFDLGKIGVVVFFAISGFIIPYSLLKYKDNNLLRFSISRFFRLYPVYWVSIILALLFIVEKSNALNVAANITMFQKFLGHDDLVGVYWTLQIELIFYILCAALFFKNLLDNNKNISLVSYAFLAIAFVFSIARFITDIKIPVAVPLALSIMFFGMLWMRFLFKEGVTKSQVFKNLLTIVVMIVPISLLAYNKDMGYEESWYRYTLSYIAALLIFIVFTTKIKLTNQVFVFLGKISYSLYLTHLIVGSMIFQHSLFGQSIQNVYLLMFLALVISLIVSTITYYFVEKPFVTLGKQTTSYILNRKQLKEIKAGA
jgi:peptidoglycan/LPS O-acetylase OafA/YrhL